MINIYLIGHKGANTLVELQLNFTCKKGPLFIVNSTDMCEALVTQNSLSNQAVFFWSTWLIYTTNLKMSLCFHNHLKLLQYQTV